MKFVTLDELMAQQAERRAQRKDAENEIHLKFPLLKELEGDHKELMELYPRNAEMLAVLLDELGGRMRKEVQEMVRILEIAPDSLKNWGRDMLTLSVKLLVHRLETDVAEWRAEERKPCSETQTRGD